MTSFLWIGGAAIGFVLVPAVFGSLISRQLAPDDQPAPADPVLAASMARHPSAVAGAPAGAPALESSMVQRLMTGEISPATYRVSMELLAWQSDGAVANN